MTQMDANDAYSERMTGHADEFAQPICNRCHHYRGYGKCAAFPDRIPDAILDDEHDHHKPYPGDNGIRFEPRDEQTQP